MFKIEPVNPLGVFCAAVQDKHGPRRESDTCFIQIPTGYSSDRNPNIDVTQSNKSLLMISLLNSEGMKRQDRDVIKWENRGG